STLSGKTALITGASSGIGLATANMLIEKGVRVIGCARRKEALDQAMQALPGESLAATLDVTNMQSVNTLLSRLPEDWREIDILINNAGSDVGGRQRFDQGRLQDWLGTIETNVSGLMQVSALMLPGMLDRGDGHIVNLGSTQGLTGAAGCAAY
ncbi:MAG: SDR family NAD(P)-dependent oxidoreductase, partial [Gammaproteobacteria bacterium]